MRLHAFNRSKLLVGFAFMAILLLMPPMVSAQWEKIAFMSQRDGNNEIYIMNSTGTDQVRLTFNSVSDHDPAFSPAGEKIAFSSHRDGDEEIYIMNPDGSGQTNLTNSPGGDSHPAFSPDGTRIVFVSERSNQFGQFGIWVMNVDGSNPVELLAGFETEPEFSPDGTKIVFYGIGASGDDMEIWIMNADGTGLTNVSQESGTYDLSPSFSRDGTKILYSRDPHGSEPPEIYVMNIDGSNKVPVPNSNGIASHPSYSVDGTRIVFTAVLDGTGEIYSMNVDGTDPINLTNYPGNDLLPVWGALNFRPVLSNVAVSSPINEGDVATLTGQIQDANPNDSFVLNIAWGDGQLQTVHYPAGTTLFELTHVYTDNPPAGTDNYVINYNIDDHRFGTNFGSTTVTVNNVNPTLSNVSVSPSQVPVGTTVTLSGNYTDPGYHGSPADEQLQVLVTWGDGQSTSVVTNGAPGAINETHQYGAAGNYTITVQVTDNDGGATVETRPLVVSASPPATPTNFRVQSVAVNSVGLAWTDASNNEDGFAIERCSAKRQCNNFVEVARVGSNVTTYVDNTVSGNTQYFYRMRAFNTGGVSSYTSVISAKTPRR